MRSLSYRTDRKFSVFKFEEKGIFAIVLSFRERIEPICDQDIVRTKRGRVSASARPRNNPCGRNEFCFPVKIKLICIKNSSLRTFLRERSSGTSNVCSLHHS
jgi:hypothetical protein